MAKPGKEKKFIKKPYYEGGKDALRAFIQKHKAYPSEAENHNIKGVVRIRMTIDMKGKVVKTQVIKKLGYGCDQEAERVVKLLRYRVPHTRALKARFHKSINIHFGLRPKVKTKSSIRYQYVLGKKDESKQTPSYSYQYTLSWGNEEE